MNTVHSITSKQQLLSILDQSKNTSFIIDFYSDACPPCKAIAPKYADLAQQNPKLCFFKVNLTEFLQSGSSNESDGLADYAKGISMIPCFKFYASAEAKEPVWEFMGANVDNLSIGIGKLEA